MPKILENNCQVIGYIESLIRSQPSVYLVARGDNVHLWQVQQDFEPIVTVREYEVPTRGIWPVRIRFEYKMIDNNAVLKVNRKGLDRLKELLPDVFESVSNDEESRETIEIAKPDQQDELATAGAPV